MKLRYLLGIMLCVSASYATDPRFEQAEIFIKKGNYDMALGEYRSYISQYSESPEGYYAAAELYANYIKDYGRALANYKMVFKYAPNMTKAYEGAAKVYEALGSKSKADSIRALDPKNKPQEALPTDIQEEPKTVQAPPAPLVEDNEKTPEKTVEKAPVQPVQNTQEKETKIAEQNTPAKTEEPFRYDGPLFQKGKKLFQEKKYNEAGAVWRDVLRQQPGNPGAYYYAGVGRYEMGELDKAEYNLKRAFDYTELGYNAHYYLSLIYKKQNQTSNEIKELESYLKASQNAEGKATAKARLDELQGKTNLNKTKPATTEKTIAVSSSSATQSLNSVKETVKVTESSSSVTVTKSNDKSSKQQEKTIVEKVTVNEPATIEKANAFFKQKNLQASLAAYKEVLENGLTDDLHAFVLLQMGNIYRERRDFRLAVSRYREVVENYPDSDWAEEAERAWKDAVWQENNVHQLPRKK